MRQGSKKGFTLTELLVAIGILAILVGILLPSLSRARRCARNVLGKINQREIVLAVTSYSLDNNDRFPPSVATVGKDERWNWREPFMLTGYERRSPQIYRSVSAYLLDYLDNADTVICPNAPHKYSFLQDAWEAGDAWDHPHPDSGTEDPVFGTYCLYWNYEAYRVEQQTLFYGPVKLAGGRRQSNLLTSDYFGYDHWQSPQAFAGCDHFGNASLLTGDPYSNDLWVWKNKPPAERIDLFLNAGYTDAHVEQYSFSDSVAIKAILWPAKQLPYPDGIGPGLFFLPDRAMYE